MPDFIYDLSKSDGMVQKVCQLNNYVIRRLTYPNIIGHCHHALNIIHNLKNRCMMPMPNFIYDLSKSDGMVQKVCQLNNYVIRRLTYPNII
jgi:hypothetical protein